VVLALKDYGLRVRQVRDASALKMSYAGITKGLIAIGAAMALGATRAGTTDDLIAEMSESQPQLLALLRKMVPDMPGKAYRWVAEMEEIAGFLDGVPGGGAIYHAIAELYRHLACEFPDGPEVQALANVFRRQNDS